MSAVTKAILALEEAAKRFEAIDSETNDKAELMCTAALQALKDADMVCVPRKPTDEMRAAAMATMQSYWLKGNFDVPCHEMIYTAMISAAQPKEFK